MEAQARQVTIYALCEPDTDEVRYIGQAANPKWRLSAHIAEARHGLPDGSSYKSRKNAWLRGLLACGKEPLCLHLIQVPEEEANVAEAAYIACYLHLGNDLVNGRKHRPCMLGRGTMLRDVIERWATREERALRQPRARREEERDRG